MTIACDYCHKPIKQYATWRDWINRKLHYKCYKILHEKAILDITMENFIASEMSGRSTR